MYYNARYYDPAIGRFTQPVSVIQNLFDPQSLNRYTYVRNNPVRYADPPGHDPRDQWYHAIWQAASSPVRTKDDKVPSGRNSGGSSRDERGGGGGEATKPLVKDWKDNTSDGGLYLLRDDPVLPTTFYMPADANPFDSYWLGLAAGATDYSTGAYSSLPGSEPSVGDSVYRIAGGDSQAQGLSWGPTDPALLNSPASSLGLPPGNSGSMLLRGTLLDPRGISVRPAGPIGHNPGGATEWVVRSPQTQIQIDQVQLTIRASDMEFTISPKYTESFTPEDFWAMFDLVP